jgi:hypothetical protein
MKKIYFIICYLCVFGFYSHGESFNLKAQFFFFLFFSANFFFTLYYKITKKKALIYNVFFFTILLFLTIYSFFVNGIKLKVFTDIIQIMNIFFVSQIIRELTSIELNNFLKTTILVSVLAGVYSFLIFGLSQQRFAPVSYVIPVASYFYYHKKDSKWITIVIIIFSFLLILLSGRRANLLLSFLGMLFVLFIFKKKLATIISLAIIFLFLNKGQIFDYLKNSSYPTLNRIALLDKDDQSMATRYKEVRTVLNKFEKEANIVTYIFGFGAAEYYQFERIWDLEYEERHHVHFTPINLYFRHGLFGLLFVLIVAVKVFKLIIIKKNDDYKLFTILIIITLIDSLFRSLFVEFYGIFFLGMSLTLSKKINYSLKEKSKLIK